MGLLKYLSDKAQLSEIKSEFDLTHLKDDKLSLEYLTLITKKYRSIETILNELRNSSNSNNKEIYSRKKQVIEDGIIDVMKQYPEIIKLKRKSNNQFSSLGHAALVSRCLHIVEYILKDKNGYIVLDQHGNNLGMLATLYGYMNLTKIALQNANTRTQQNNDGNNIGLILADKAHSNSWYLWGEHPKHTSIIEALNMALSFEDCSIQQNKQGYNIGMICAKYPQWIPAPTFVTAATNQTARNQTNIYGDTMLDIAINNGYSPVSIRNQFGYDIDTDGVAKYRQIFNEQMGM